MSVQAITWAYEQYDLEPSLKLLLVTLANRTNHETGICFPGQALLAKECNMGERTVRRHLKTLEDRGYLERRPRMLSDGRGRTSDEYRLAYRHPFNQPANLAARSEDQPANPERPTGQSVPTNRPPVAGEPEENQKKNRKSAPASSRKHPMPEGWRPSDDTIAKMRERYPDLDLKAELEDLRDWTLAGGYKYVDWDATFRKHCKRAAERNAPKLRKDHKGRTIDEQGRIVTPYGRFR